MHLSLSEVLEASFMLIVITFVLMLSLASSYDVNNHFATDTELVDKNSTTDYGIVLDSHLVGVVDLEDMLISAMLGCDTEKLSNITLSIFVNDTLISEKNIHKASITTMKDVIDLELAKWTTAYDIATQYATEVGLSEVHLNVYIRR